MAREVNFGKMLHGGDYNPEQWLHSPEILEKDIEYFKKAKINEVSLGIFSWAVLEPVEGEFHFEWMEKIIDRLYENGISTILATPTGARPRWMAQKYPEVLRVDASRHRNLYGERHNHCYTSPVYREKTRIMNTKLAEKFKDHPGVIAWHISNEYGGECHCPLCQAAFKNWLKDKYQTADKMNRAWATTFWSHRYNDFDQVDSPSPRGDSSLHGLNLDWKRFVTDQTVDFVKWEIQALRDAGSDKPTTINMMYDFQGLNYHKFADVVDFVSWDNYPQWHKKEEYLTAMDNGMQHDIMRSIQKKPFLLMENCPSATNWQSVSKLKKPGMLHAASMQAVAHGSDSILYFQLRQSQGSSEKFHGAVIDHYGGDDTRVFREVTEVGEALEQIQETVGTSMRSQAAVLYDRENDWAIADVQGPRNVDMHYREAVQKNYRALREQGLNVDVIAMEHSLSDYKVLAAPMAYMFKDGYEEKLRAYVENGGTLVLSYWSGLVDGTDRCFLGGTPYGLMDVAGLRSTETDALYDWEENHAIPEVGSHLGISNVYTCKNLCELVKVSDAEVLMRYGEDFYQGYPVLTHKAFGKGHVYYVCADMEIGFYQDFYGRVAAEAGLKSPIEIIPEGVSVTVRENEDTEYLFIQNYARKPQAVPVPAEYELLYGTESEVMAPLQTRILKKHK